MTKPSRRAPLGGAATAARGAQALRPRRDRFIRGSEAAATRNNRRPGDQQPKPVQTAKVGRPFPSPFAGP